MKYKYRYINSRHAIFVGVFILEKPQTKCVHWDWDPTGQNKKSHKVFTFKLDRTVCESLRDA